MTVYGYVRGTHFKTSAFAFFVDGGFLTSHYNRVPTRPPHSHAAMNVHIPGCGEATVRDIGLLEDPCPPPVTWDGSKKIKRRLDERDRLIYAPMSDVGGIVYDRDATFVEVPEVCVDAFLLGRIIHLYSLLFFSGARSVQGGWQGAGRH